MPRRLSTDELAKNLFAVGNVTSVFMQDKFLTVTKTDDRVARTVAAPIRAAAGLGGQTGAAVAPRVFSKSRRRE